ncbi:MAG: N-acetylmuramoyl-L-alanine amidase [Eubacterium sp.]|nr:N-acetylmuramoyl-L-alanine amidase [Eubacterium sp.]
MKKKKFIVVLLMILCSTIIIGFIYVEQKWGVKKLWDSYFPNGKTVVILDAGHGDYDPGCGTGEPYEKDITLKIVKKVQRQLEEQGMVVILTREKDRFISLGDRVRCSRIYNGDVFVSVHLNWAENKEAYGIETYCNEILNADSVSLANAIQKEVLNETDSKDREVHPESDFYVVRNSKVPSCLVEVGFLSAKEEGKKLKEDKYQKKIANGITKGIEHYLQQKE